MATSAHIDFNLHGPASLTTPLSVFQRLIEGGWTTNDHGGVTYLPVGDSENYDWKTASLTLSNIHDLFIEKQNSSEVIGIVLTIQPDNIGGSLVFYPSQLLTFSAIINRRKLALSGSTDFSWYIDRLVPSLCQGEGISVSSITASESH